ncbi:MAG: glutamate 5-kinase [Clostridia bacterium]|nr:glutamate 5-kinase [Clostridia bacterium]
MSGKKIIVVKIGTSSLTSVSGAMAPDRLRILASQIADLHDTGHMVILVTSGAIAAGYSLLGYHERPASVAARQASAAVGQGLLMEEYTRALAERGIVAAQLLLTRADFNDKRRYTNAWSALEVLLARGAVPIINENDTVSIAELKLGDNDMLSAQVAAMVHADLLILATDTDGLYTADPRSDENAEHIPLVERVTPELLAMAGGSGTKNSTGGMATKLAAARLATNAGVAAVICSSREENVLTKAVSGTAKGTYFKPQKGMKTRLQWMAFYAPTSGSIFIDPGAAEALCNNGRSLLPAGIKSAAGDFKAGDIVEVFLADSNRRLGRGVVNYDIGELREILGLPTSEAVKRFPGRRPEAVHRDDWVYENVEEAD